MESTINDYKSEFKVFLEKPTKTLSEVYTFLHGVPFYITNFVKVVEKSLAKDNKLKKNSFAIMVYLMQCCTAYQLFKKFESEVTEHEEVVYEIKRCLCKRLKTLLDNSTIIFDNNEDTSVGSFIHLMDKVLDKIAEIDAERGPGFIVPILNTVSSIVEEILCLSMSVAQVAYDDDNKIITASCKTVLNEMKNLKTEVNSKQPNIAMCNLVIDSCSDTLCVFETKVNTAVLRLCLNVFSKYKDPIESLHSYCINSKTTDDKLDLFISEFDLHMDRIFQICSFSITSSTVGKGVADIKSVTANLEFLETELVPAFVAITKNESSHIATFAQILKKAWIGQVKHLRTAVHSIIEPSAYCKLVASELKERVEAMWQTVSKKKNIEITYVDACILFAQELRLMFNDCMDSALRDKTNSQLEIVHKVLNELVAAKNLFRNEISTEFNKALNKRLFKRCQILQVTIERLWYCSTDSTQGANELTMTKCPDGNVTLDDQALRNIIAKSKVMVKDRSMCYLNTDTFTKTLKGNNTKQLNGEKLKQRARSYRQNDKTFVEGCEDISQHVLFHMTLLEE